MDYDILPDMGTMTARLLLRRKNALFAGHDDRAENWAILASLIETCLCRLPNYAEWFWEEPVICAYWRVVERSSSQFHSA